MPIATEVSGFAPLDDRRPLVGARWVREQGFPDSVGLRARHNLLEFANPPIDVVQEVIDIIEWPDAGTVLDVGSGTGRYFSELRRRFDDLSLVGIDLSLGMLNEARPAIRANGWVCGDQASLPVASASIDVAFAGHVVEFAADINRALAELRRVCGGTALVVCDGRRHLERLLMVLNEATVGHVTFPRDRFNLDFGHRLLDQHFDSVVMHRWEGSITVPDIEPLLDYTSSLKPFLAPQLPGGLLWDSVVTEVRQRLESHLDQHGVFESATDLGVFVCR